MSPDTEVEEVLSHRDLRAFVHFPWQVYHNDPNWAPALISDGTGWRNTTTSTSGAPIGRRSAMG